jgi:hypothetical protein
VSPSWSVSPSRIRARSETWSLAQDGVSATSPCSGQRIDGSRAVTNASNPTMSSCRQVPSVNATAWQARPHCGHGNREPARKPRRRSTRRRSKSISLLTTRHGGSSCNASSNSCFMLRTGTPSVIDRAWYPPDTGEPGYEARARARMPVRAILIVMSNSPANPRVIDRRYGELSSRRAGKRPRFKSRSGRVRRASGSSSGAAPARGLTQCAGSSENAPAVGVSVCTRSR